MKRLLALALLAFPATAHADVTPLARVTPGAEIALAGDSVVFTEIQGRVARVYSVPLAGGPRKREFAYTAPANTAANLQLSASGRQVAVAVAAETNESILTQAFTGPLGAPWTALGPPTRLFEATNVFRVQLDGDRLFSYELRGSFANAGVTVRDPEPHDVPFYSPTDALRAQFAGDLVAYAASRPGERDEGAHRRIVLKNWRTGEPLGTVDLEYTAEIGALRADGTVLTRGSPITLWRPGAAPRSLVEASADVAFAGDRVLWTGEDGVHVIEPGGATRRLGPPTRTGVRLATDGQRAFWVANGCLLTASLEDDSHAAPGPGPCPRSELATTSQPEQTLARSARVRIRCVAAPTNCGGTIRLPGLSRARRFSLAAGRTKTFAVPLTAGGYAALARRLRSQGATYPEVVIRTDDGAVLTDVTIAIDRR